MAPATAVAVAAAVAIALALLPSPVPDPGPMPSSGDAAARPALIDAERLRTNSLLAQAGVEPWASQVRTLQRAASKALACEVDVAAAGADSFGASVGALGTSSACAYTLAVAATMGGDPRFVRRAAELAMAWTAADPCRIWGRGCDATTGTEVPSPSPGDIARLDGAATEFVLAADLTRRRGGFPGQDADELAAWLAQLVPDDAPVAGADGDLDVVLRIATAGFAGDTAARDAAFAEWRRRLSDLRTDGRLTDGSDEILGLEATQRSLGLRLLGVTLAGSAGREMLAAAGPGGVGLRDAVDALAAGMADPASWPDGVAPAPEATWELAYALWGTPTYRPILATFRERPLEGESPLRWGSLVFGLADSRVLTSTSPAPVSPPVPTSTPAPTPTPTPVPAVGAPVVALRQGIVADGNVPARISWAKASGLPAGPVSYRIQVRKDGERWRDIVTTDKTSLVTRLPVGPLLELRVRAAAEDAATSRWATGEPFELALIEAQLAIPNPASAWKLASNSGYSRRTLLYSERRGSTITFSVEGRGIALRVPVGPTRGRAWIRIDGGPAILIDEFASRFSPAVIAFVQRWDAPGRHEVAIEVVGTRGRETVSIDALVVLP
ncbi:MAG: alginate lyase family protein [Chloroflexi bacterium]|nr:alginate lyase family protein [Chloroflexota bacterium]